MINKVNENLNNKTYIRKIDSAFVTGYENEAKWIDYLISDKIIFSHRNTHFNAEKIGALHASDYYQVLIFKSGSMEYVTEKLNLMAEPNTVIISKPLTFHMNRHAMSETCDRYILYFMESLQYESCFDACIFDVLNATNESSMFIKFSDEQAATLFQQLDQIEKVLEADTKYSNALAMALFTELFVFLSQNTHLVSKLKLEQSNNSQAKIYEIKSYIDSNYVSINNIADLEKKFFYSREYITREFKQYFNTPIYHYILERKLLLSKKYINMGMTIEKSVHLAGFSNMSSYVKLFKRNMGMTPSEYQKSQRTQKNK